ncbi:MAG: metal-binding protein ZinT [Arcicella sp.]|nr:metal-binding protein ZinT [Arcicella sp.]
MNAAEVKALYDGNNVATITINANKVVPCGGDNVTFTATGASSTAQYQWKVDGVNVGTNSKTFTYNSANKTVDYQVKVLVEVKDEEVCFPQKTVMVESTVTIKNCSPPPTAIDLKNGLVACYPFNANANDATGNGNNGTVNGATLTTDRFGKVNSAYNFN